MLHIGTQHIGFRTCLSLNPIPFAFFEGEGGEGSGAQTPPVTPPPTTPPPVTPPPQAKTYTQEQVNSMMATEKNRLRDENKKLIEQLQTLQGTANLTQNEKDELATRIEQLQTQYQTEAEQKQTELKKAQTKYDTDTKKLSTERDGWRERFEQKSIAVDIAAAASKYNAWNVSQLQAMVGPMTKMVETVDEGGKPSGIFEPRVDFKTKDKEQKDVTLQITVDEAVKRMTEDPGTDGNLFRGKGVSGLQESIDAAANGGGIPNVEEMSLEQYKAKRPQIRQAMSHAKSG